VNLTLRITGGTGFGGGLYLVTGVAAGVATLSTAPGTIGSTGGQAALSCGALTVRGFLAPADSWPLPTQNCPLPDRAHMAVVWRVAKFCVIQFPTKDNLARVGLINAEYTRALGLLEAESHRLTEATGHADLRRSAFGGGY